GASPPPPSPAGRDIIPIVAQGPPAGHAMIGSLIFRWNRSPTAEYSTRPRFASTMEAMMYVPMPRRSPFVDRPYVLNSRSAMSGGSGAVLFAASSTYRPPPARLASFTHGLSAPLVSAASSALFRMFDTSLLCSVGGRGRSDSGRVRSSDS